PPHWEGGDTMYLLSISGILWLCIHGLLAEDLYEDDAEQQPFPEKDVNQMHKGYIAQASNHGFEEKLQMAQMELTQGIMFNLDTKQEREAVVELAKGTQPKGIEQFDNKEPPTEMEIAYELRKHRDEENPNGLSHQYERKKEIRMRQTNEGTHTEKGARRRRSLSPKDSNLPLRNIRQRNKRNINNNKGMHWTKGTDGYAYIPWEWGETSTPAARNDVNLAQQYVHEHTCLRFVPYTETVHEELGLEHESWANFTHKCGCCWSYVGRLNSGGQDIHATPTYNYNIDLALHEFGHMFGMVHEQQAEKAWERLKFRPENIDPTIGKDSWERTEFHHKNNYISFHPVDIASVLTYSNWFASGTEWPTMEPLDPRWEYLWSAKQYHYGFYD
ncbi:unnamed protein product, partial [Owenia fusiformis]